MSFSDSLKRVGNLTHTENGAVALETTGSGLLDLFSVIGAMRQRSEQEIRRFSVNAIREDKALAIKMAFYARNIRGGLGERRTFRTMLRILADLEPEVLTMNIVAGNIQHFGRWDDLYALVGTSVEGHIWDAIRSQMSEDLENMSEGNPISLMGKWLKSVNTSSAESRRFGRLTARALGYTDERYRRTLSALRGYLGVVETYMSTGSWTGIKYSAVPGNAMKNYRKAFGRHDADGFGRYVELVKKGKEKINSGTLFPYDILLAGGLRAAYSERSPAEYSLGNWDFVLESQWHSLPNYVGDGDNVLVVSDTSGSMKNPNMIPLASSLGLALYFAERNHGVFHNTFITFSSKPEVVILKGNTLKEKIENINAIIDNTNLEAVYDLILAVAVRSNAPAEDMPKAIVVISDMQFDKARRGCFFETFHESMQRKFRNAGYAMPKTIYWNVEGRADTFQGDENSKDVMLVSGYSPSTFKSILDAIDYNAYEAMVNTLENPIYDCVIVA
jgi:hypothetical protein